MNYEQIVKDFLALLIWREARNQQDDAMCAVGYSVLNRANSPRWWGYDLLTVITHPYQYSSFNVTDPNAILYPKQDNTVWLRCKTIAGQILDGMILDPTEGCTYYHSKMARPPLWAENVPPHNIIGDFHFFLTEQVK